MKRVIFSLLMLMLASAAWAVDVVFDATVDVGTGSSTAAEYTITKDGITLDVEQGIANGVHYRFYKNKKVVITSAIGPMTKIVFECIGSGDQQYGPGGFTAEPGDYVPIEKQGIWVGCADRVVFTATNFQVRATKITVTVGGDVGLFPPHITPAGGTYYGPVDVSMSCSTEGAEIFYTTDGSTPTTASTLYTASFKVSEATTVKAISAKDDMVSEVVTASYDIAPSVCLGDLEAMDNNEQLVFDHEATVLYQYGNYLYLRDECDGVPGYGLIYGNTGQTYNTGDIIPPGWGGTKTTYDGHAELTNLTGFKPASRYEVIQPEVITIPQVGEDYWAHYVLIRDVYIDKERQLVIDQQGNSCPYYPQLTQEVDPTELLNVVAIVTSFRGEYQLFIIVEQTFPPYPLPVICCLEDLYMLNQGKVAQFECPLTAIYQMGNYLYVKDSCDAYGLIYGANVGGPFMNGDQIKGCASWTVYSGTKQLANYGEWSKTEETEPVEPEVMPIEELSVDMVHMFVKLENVTLGGDVYEPLIEDETGSVLIFNRFNVEIIEDYGYGWEISPDVNMDYEVNIADINCIIDRILKGQTTPEWVGGDGTYDVIGFVSIYKDRIEIIPIKIVHHCGKYVLIGDVNGDGELNIADVNVIIDLILSD
jgi:hypothetical protein